MKEAWHIPVCVSYCACVWKSQTWSRRWYCSLCTSGSLHHNIHKYWPTGKDAWMTAKRILQAWDFYLWTFHLLFLTPELNTRKRFFKTQQDTQCVGTQNLPPAETIHTKNIYHLLVNAQAKSTVSVSWHCRLRCCVANEELPIRFPDVMAGW